MDIPAERPRFKSPPIRTPGTPLALAGIRIADFSHFLAGPFCSLILADLGAEVIKIEKTDGGDDFRKFQPSVGTREGAPFIWGNRNKKSVALDLKRPEGLAVARDLVARSDVLIENFATGVMDRLGLGYEALCATNPRLIYCSISAYGRQGALKDRLGFDPVVQAESGYMAMNGDPGEVGMKSTASIMDISTGMMASNAILAALFAREQTGQGQYVECALFDQAITMLGFHAMNFLVTGVLPQKAGNNSRETVPTAAFAASDGWFYVSCANDRTFQKLVLDAMNLPNLAVNPDFASNKDRVRNRDRLLALLGATFRGNKRAYWMEKMRNASVPAGPINSMAEAFNSPEMRHRELVSEIPHPTAGSVPNIALPFKLHGTPLAEPTAAPLLGQHSDSVLRDILGYDQTKIDALVSSGVMSLAGTAQ
jgi:crotonobetainyl-CoA:carnitine CoA-transferase CaiB-like acyl-CoA transferase